MFLLKRTAGTWWIGHTDEAHAGICPSDCRLGKWFSNAAFSLYQRNFACHFQIRKRGYELRFGFLIAGINKQAPCNFLFWCYDDKMHCAGPPEIFTQLTSIIVMVLRRTEMTEWVGLRAETQTTFVMKRLGCVSARERLTLPSTSRDRRDERR